MQYDEGKVLFKNSIDKFKYLLKHRNEVAQQIGMSSETIYQNRRNLNSISEYLSRLQDLYEIGDLQKNMQMYISRHDRNFN